MTPGRGAAGRALLLLASAGLSACAPQAPGLPRLVRLVPSLGRAEPRTKGNDTRPAVLLHPGETRSCSLQLPKGSSLRFSLGFEEPPAGAFLRFRVTANGRAVFARRLFVVRNRKDWWDFSVPLETAGAVTLEFHGDHVLENGDPVPPDAAPKPWIMLASPRVDTPGPPARRRVLVWISQDTVRADHLGAYGYRRRTTAAFDRLAKDWVVFDDAAAPASWTLPSLVSQFTSRYPTFHGAVRERVLRDETQPTVFEALAGEGFAVLGATGNHFVSADFRTADGFDLLSFSEVNGQELNRLALAALESWGGGDLALFVHYMDPHTPYDPPAPFDRLFDPEYRGPVNGRNFKGFGPRALTSADVEHVKAVYDGEVACADEAIGALLETLRSRGLLEDAVIVYSADHGEEFLDHGGWVHGHTLYEEMLHVPFAVRVGSVRARRVTQLVSLVDLAPTLLDALGIRPPGSFQGRSLLPLLRGERLPEEPVYAETELDGDQRVAVREGRRKYMLVARPGREVPPQIVKEEVYDLAADALERSPLRQPPDLERMRRQAVAYLTHARTEAKPPTPAHLSPEMEEKLRALGYLK